MKAPYLILPITLLIGLTACDPGPAPLPEATPSSVVDPSEPPLTALQEHIKEDALKEVADKAISKQGVIDYLAKEYPVEDVKAGVAGMACETDWLAEAAQYAKEKNATDRSVLLDAGFTEEEADYGINPPAE